MKNFNDLKIGDVIYKVTQNYEAEKGPQLKEIKVHNLILDNNNLQINKYQGYNTHYLINEDVNKLNINIIRESDSFLTTDKNLVNQGLKETGMKLISRYEAEIERQKLKIQETRKLYFEYLNWKEI